MTTTKRFFYATANQTASDFDAGFAKTYQVFAFSSRVKRDEYVSNGNMGAKAIKRSDIGSFLEPVKPFSGRAFWFIPLNFLIDQTRSSFLISIFESGASYEVASDYTGAFKLNDKRGN